MCTKLHSNLGPTAHECLHLVTRGRFRSRDKDGDHTIRSAIAKNPMLHANFMALYYVLYNRTYYQSKFYIAEIRIFDLFAPVTLTLTR